MVHIFALCVYIYSCVFISAEVKLIERNSSAVVLDKQMIRRSLVPFISVGPQQSRN